MLRATVDGVLFHLLGGEARVAAVDEKTFAAADAGQHPADEVGVVAVVVVGVGEDVDQNVRRLEGCLGALAVGVLPAAAGVEIRGVHEDQRQNARACFNVKRTAGLAEVLPAAAALPGRPQRAPPAPR